jgi:hypothetical protein
MHLETHAFPDASSDLSHIATTNYRYKRATTVATNTPAATAMAGVQTTINNQLKAAAAMAMETATMTTIKT